MCRCWSVGLTAYASRMRGRPSCATRGSPSRGRRRATDESRYLDRQAFVAVIDAGSLTHVAARVNLSLAALSGRTLVQISVVKEKAARSPLRRQGERSAFQTAGAVISLRCRLVRSNCAFRMRCASSIPEIVTAASKILVNRLNGGSALSDGSRHSLDGATAHVAG